MSNRRSRSPEVGSEPADDIKEHGKHPGFLIRRLHQISVSLFFDRMREAPITPPQYTIMRIVDRHPGWNQKKVATTAVLDASTTRDIIHRLETRGFVKRVGGTDDRRMNAVYLTEDGRKVLAAAEKVVQSAQSELLAALPREQQEKLLGMLSVLIEAHTRTGQGKESAGPWRRHGPGLAKERAAVRGQRAIDRPAAKSQAAGTS